MKTVFSSAIILLIAALASTGCYRTVANIHVDESNKLVVTKAEDAKDDEVPSVEETEDGGQVVRISREEHRITVSTRLNADERARLAAGGIPKTSESKSFKGPGALSLGTGHKLKVEDVDGDQYYYSTDNVDRITLRLHDSNRSKVRAGIALTTIGCLTLAGGVGWLGEGSIAAPFLISSVAFLGPGIPLWISGGKNLVDDQKYNRGLKILGISLSVTGALLVATGAVMTGMWGGFELPLLFGLGFGGPLLAFGIPLWIVGAYRLKRLKKNSAALPEPTIAISPETSTYGLGLKWRI